MRVHIDITKLVILHGSKDDGSKCYAFVKYEGLETFCCKRGIIGHLADSCVVSKGPCDENGEVFRYGDWMRVPVFARSSRGICNQRKRRVVMGLLWRAIRPLRMKEGGKDRT